MFDSLKIKKNFINYFGIIYFVLFFSLILLNSCSIQQLAAKATSGLIQDGLAAISSETDLILAESGAATSLTLVEGLLKSDPDNINIRLAAAQGYTGYALAFAEDQSKSRALELYKRGRNHALHAWSLIAKQNNINTPETSLLINLKELRKYLSELGEEYIPVIYWTANSWAGMINNSRNSPLLLADIPIVMELASFITTHEPGFGYAGAHLILGSLGGTVPSFLGGSPIISQQHFDLAIKLTDGKFLMSYVLYAQIYAVQMQDYELFKSLLEQVLSSPPNLLPEQGLANSIARIRAKYLMMTGEELFES